MNVLEKFVKYVKIESTSVPDSEVCPSAEVELTIAAVLRDELLKIGVKDAFVNKNGFVIGHIPASRGYESKKKIGFIAHIDTSPEFSGKNVSPQIIADYDGKEVRLGSSSYVLSEKENPHLKDLKGRTLITTDGTTLLGADDKAGVAEIMSAMEDIIAEDIPHTAISISFTPDEEIGTGSGFFPFDEFDADVAYTIDGGDENEFEKECFNAYGALIEIKGNSVHTGYAKGIMVNASSIAAEFAQMLPENEKPETTEGREGFYHLDSIEGGVDRAVLKYILRDFTKDGIIKRIEKMEELTSALNRKYGDGTVSLKTKHQYSNMNEVFDTCPYVIDYAVEAMKRSGLSPILVPIRGGTDGARLSFEGLPCPNLGTGAYCFHGPYEHITLEGMEKSIETVKNIVDIYTNER